MKNTKNFLKYHPVVFMIVIVIMGLYIWQNRLENSTDDNQMSKDISSYQLIGQSCNGSECLLSSRSDMIGLSNITGYYEVVSRSAWGATEECDGFVITGGSEKTTGYFSDLVKAGNTVNSTNDQSQSVINLNLENLEQVAKQKLLSSTKENPVNLSVFFPLWPHTGAPTCFSFIEVLGVK
jgi:hypothetical protein